MKRITVPLFFLTLICLLAPQRASAITIDTVPVGNAGNAADQNYSGQGQFGAVANPYRIGTTEVTNSQYVAFLNAKAGSDPLGLYQTFMDSHVQGGISRSGSSPNFSYAVKTNMGNKPVNFVSWYDSIRFANWLNNGQGSGDTESGAYTLLGGTPTPSNGLSIVRNAGATVFLPSENEWYKAGYYQPTAQGGDADNYWLYSTRSNAAPTFATVNSVGDISNPGTNVANYNWDHVVGRVITVGSAGASSASFYGTFDQAGNVWEWNEVLIDGSRRGLRGGSLFNVAFGLSAAYRDEAVSGSNDYDSVGFRVASVPEPSTLALAGIGAAILGLGAVRRRKHARVAHACTVRHASGLPARSAALLLALGAMVSLAVPHARAELLVSSWGNARVLRYDNAGNFIDTFITPGSGGLIRPYQVAVGPDHNLYVGSAGTDNVLRYSGATGQFIAPFAFGGGLNEIRGSIFGPDGNLYVSNPDGGPIGANIVRFDGATGALMGGFASGGGLDTPLGLTFGPDNNLYVSNGHGRNVLRYNGTSGAFIDAFVSIGSGGLDNPEGLVFGPDGNLYVASVATNSVLRYHGTTGSFMGAFVPPGKLNSPYGLVFGPDNNLYVSSGSDSSILRFDGMTGDFLDVFITPGSGGLLTPTFLTFTPVPESSSLALLGIGALSLLGFGLRYGRSGRKTAQ